MRIVGLVEAILTFVTIGVEVLMMLTSIDVDGITVGSLIEIVVCSG